MANTHDTRQPAPQPDIAGDGRGNPGETLGGYRRRTGNNDTAGRLALAVELVQEARRRVLQDRLEGCFSALTHGAEPEQVGRRLHVIASSVTAPDPYYDCRCQFDWHPWCPVHQRSWSPDGAA